MKKKKIKEIIDSNEVIIGADDQPQVDNNKVTQSNQMTDKAAKTSHQPFDDKFWGTFGFSLYETLTEDEMIEIAEDIISKRTDKSMKEKKDDKELVFDKMKKIKDLFADLSDQEKADILKKI